MRTLLKVILWPGLALNAIADCFDLDDGPDHRKLSFVLAFYFVAFIVGAVMYARQLLYENTIVDWHTAVVIFLSYMFGMGISGARSAYED